MSLVTLRHSVIGFGLAARMPNNGCSLPPTAFRKASAAAPIVGEAKALRAMPEDSPEEIAAKRKRFEAALVATCRRNLRIASDLYVAAFLTPKVGGVPANRSTVMIPTTAHVWAALAGQQVYGPLVARAQDLAGEVQAFHWPLEFSDVISAGGFDAVLGNPPWERIKLQEQEFFAARDPEIATAPNAAARGKLITKLKEAAPATREHALYEEFEVAKRAAEASSLFARVPAEEGGRFPLTGRGDVNTYALFAELFASLASKCGRAGMIVPTGIATDATTAPFFAALIEGKRLTQLVDFENRERLFPAVDSRMKFSLLTIGREAKQGDFAFFLTDPLQLDEPERRFTLSVDDIACINPNTRTAPVFRSRADAELTAKIYARVPVLIDEAKGADGNLWGFQYATKLFDMADDSGLFRTAAQLRDSGFVREGSDWISLALAHGAPARQVERYVPLYEAKLIHHFDHRWATYDNGDSRDVTAVEKIDPDFEVTPRYWVPQSEVAHRLAAKGWTRGWLMGWRDITNATNERTVIATAFPRTAAAHTLRLMAVTAEASLAAVFLALASSLVLDFLARQKIAGTHFTVEMWRQMPIPPPSFYTPADVAFIFPRVLELTYTSHSMTSFARALGYDGPPFKWDEERRAHLRAEIDAFSAHAYGLTRDELRYILDPADVKGPDYPSETFRVLKNNEIRQYGEYRTACLVLQAWNRMERGELAA
jgi:hypothetical protein